MSKTLILSLLKRKYLGTLDQTSEGILKSLELDNLGIGDNKMVDLEAIKKAKNEYMKEWRKKNKDKVKAAQERYWEKKIKEQGENNSDEQPED